MPQTRMASSRSYITAARRGLFSSFFARIQGAVSSMYLLARLTTLNTSAKAFWKAKASISFT